MKKINIIKSMLILACLFGITSANAQFTQTSKIVSENREGRAEYGTSVALKENFAIVGASRENGASGAAYIYSKDTQGTWAYTQTLSADDSNEGAEYGGGVKFSDDYLVVAAGRADVNGTIRAGALYVYDYQNNSWEFSTKIVASDLSGDAKLAMNPTSLDVEGNTIIAGAPGEDSWTGSVYVFTKVDGVWEETQKIMSPDPLANDIFGIGVSISGDQLLVGAQGVNDRVGVAYLYIKNASGLWEYNQTIAASNGEVEDYFGSSVTIQDDKIVVGAYGTDLEVGTAYIFEKNTEGTFEEVQILNANPSTDRVQFGWATAINEDYIAVTAPHIYGNEVAEVYFYKKDADGTWIEDQIIQGDDTVGEDFYGWSIAMFNNEMIVGAPRVDFDANGDNEMGDAGAAYIFMNTDILGVTDNEINSNLIQLYPNPTRTDIKIESISKMISAYSVYSVNGTLLQEFTNLNTNFSVLNTSNYSNGMYFLEINFEDGSSVSKKIIKN
ncbi:T9SS type A sorting domain-containing protein [Aequorivita viscosa]|uniref:Por secretion system C-terminal sorting domain-containing protein n=1 Tax=Aequorivita viscosa TaxID=797419 RepID=A0A1M6M7V5_9FLAO|nr:T9SS type A sorting domain-containing protein [Aequorivita viscosa]SDX27918.1 Por secretion system C-terminal sorting domain-containing protein [Aequorivita viscosa]SHJ79547.1 Por secretion system C-terminal sorting domain-containing protein [Aequorivita viscosa]